MIPGKTYHGKMQTLEDYTGLEKQSQEAENKAKAVIGKKDFTKPEHNELFATVGR